MVHFKENKLVIEVETTHPEETLIELRESIIDTLSDSISSNGDGTGVKHAYRLTTFLKDLMRVES